MSGEKVTLQITELVTIHSAVLAEKKKATNVNLKS